MSETDCAGGFNLTKAFDIHFSIIPDNGNASMS